jgi:Berberine and berberine like
LAHCGGDAVIALAGSAAIGVDLELVRPIADVECLARLVFPDVERREGAGETLSFTYSARHLHELNLSDATRVLQLNARWADELWKTMQPFSSGGVYVNYLGDEGEDRVKAGYGTNYQRLVALKNKYDPTNLFRFNQNIVPTRKNSSSGTA